MEEIPRTFGTLFLTAGWNFLGVSFRTDFTREVGRALRQQVSIRVYFSSIRPELSVGVTQTFVPILCSRHVSVSSLYKCSELVKTTIADSSEDEVIVGFHANFYEGVFRHHTAFR